MRYTNKYRIKERYEFMVNKKVVFSAIIICFIGVFLLFFNKPSIDSRAGLLMDASTGDVLFAKNEDLALPVASISKLMSAYLVVEAIEDGTIDWDELVVISENANVNEQQAVQITVSTGESMSVRDLFASLLIPSANNAAVALAEHIAGSEEQFTKMMNEKAASIGLSDESLFVNSTGLTINGERNTMSAIDAATLAYRLMTDFPVVLDFTEMPFYDLEHSAERIYNTNRLLHSNEQKIYDQRVDGLKTGYTNDARYCLVSTAKSHDERYISVILGSEDDEMRFQDTKKLLSYAFQPFYAPWLDDVKAIGKALIP